MDHKRALAAYVSGRNGGWDSELKSVPAGPTHTEDALAGAAPASDGAPPVHAGVPVPDRLAFERGPGTWRGRLEDVSHR